MVLPSELRQAPSEVTQENISVCVGLRVRMTAVKEKVLEGKDNIGEVQQPGCKH